MEVASGGGRFAHLGGPPAHRAGEPGESEAHVAEGHPGLPQAAQPPRSDLKRILKTHGNTYNVIFSGKTGSEIAHDVISVI